MATRKKQSGKWYAVIRKKDNTGIVKYHSCINLMTTLKSEVKPRINAINEVEDKILSGEIKKEDYPKLFRWMNATGTSTLVKTIDEEVEKYLGVYRNRTRENSYKRMVLSLNHFIKSYGSGKDIADMDDEHIEKFIEYSLSIGHIEGGINLNLRNIKSFLRWCDRRKNIKRMPIIPMFKNKKKPKYLNQEMLQKLFNLESIDKFYLDAFLVYLETGARRNEILSGKIDGMLLIVPAELSKSGVEREIDLMQHHIDIIKSIHQARDEYLSVKGNTLDNFASKFSKRFKSACDELGYENYHLHCLRHTFAVRQWIITKDIYQVKTLLGHTSVTTTEVYTQFKLSRLENDFKNDWAVRLEVENVIKNAQSIKFVYKNDMPDNDSLRGNVANA